MQLDQVQLVDARSNDRFRGVAPEPRPGLRQGRICSSLLASDPAPLLGLSPPPLRRLTGFDIPGARNVPFTEVLTPDKTRLLDEASLRAAFVARGVDPTRPTAVSCGSGITACVLALALHQLGNRNVAVYDGSWAEYGQQSKSELPVERG